MTVTAQTASEISNSLVRVMKIVASMKHHMPATQVDDIVGLDHSHFPILFTIGHEPRRVGTLAECLHSDISTVSRQVSHLAQIGLVEKISDPDDGRAQLLSLTPSGRDVVTELAARRAEWFEQLLTRWNEDDARAFLGQLTRFGDDVELFKAELLLGPLHHDTSPSATTSASTGATSTTDRPSASAEVVAAPTLTSTLQEH